MSLDDKKHALHEEFRSQISAELTRRCKQNPLYSMRAFAKHLEVDFSTLSKILRGERKLGSRAILKLGTKLGLKPSEIQKYLQPSGSTEDYHPLNDDIFEVISDWQHFAILELLRIKDFEPNVKWVAKCLGLKTHEAQAAIDRLVRLEMLQISPTGGGWKELTSTKTSAYSSKVTSQPRKQLQRQILEKAISALEDTPISLRDQSAMTLAVDASKLPEAKERIKKFRRGLSKFLSRGSPCTDVYHLSVSLYPVTQTAKRN